MYGTQAHLFIPFAWCMFENDVNMYGTQATMPSLDVTDAFENDVNIQYRQIFHDNGI